MYGPPGLGYYGLYGVEFVDNLRGYAAGGGNRYGWSGSYFGIFLKTEDGGNTWTTDTIIFENDPWGVAPVSLDMVSKNWVMQAVQECQYLDILLNLKLMKKILFITLQK